LANDTNSPINADTEDVLKNKNTQNYEGVTNLVSCKLFCDKFQEN